MKEGVMPKAAKKKKSASKRMKGGKKVATAKFDGMSFICKGKKVRAGKKKTKVARVFCARKA
jgi:hypothetical protein